MPRITPRSTIRQHITDAEYFPRCEFHTRFPALFKMDNPAKWSTYHRSAFKRIVGVTQTGFHFLGNQPTKKDGMMPKTGNFYNPFAFKKYRQALTKGKSKITQSPPAFWYDAILNRQKMIAADVVSKVRAINKKILVNSDNQYPCVLFKIPKPDAEKNINTWSQLVAIYVLAITNKLAYERGINIEMVRRSSFGCLRPAISDCDQSVRINIGLSPVDYADCVVNAIVYTHRLFGNIDNFKVPVVSKSLTNELDKYNKLRSPKVKITQRKYLWDTLWANGDVKNHSFASQFFRTKIVPEKLIDLIFEANLDKPIADIFASPELIKKTFATPLIRILKAIRIVDKKISINITMDTLKEFQWENEQVVQDQEFWDFSADLAARINVPERLCQQLRNGCRLNNFHNFFELKLKEFFFNPPKSLRSEDGYGSDSEADATYFDPDNGEVFSFYAKKLITATGMRAIQLTYAAARLYLQQEHETDSLQVSFYATGMYYETHQALSAHPIPIVASPDELPTRGKQRNISFFDRNYCNTSHQRPVTPKPERNDKVFVVDTTSATTEETYEILHQLWDTKPDLEVIFTVSSGLKNEQSMADYNPYGTIRIFTKNKAIRETAYDLLTQLEDNADYQHPAASHWLRRTAKSAGMTPTNNAILKCTSP